jgi:phosphate-selective porin OprO/OprP
MANRSAEAPLLTALAAAAWLTAVEPGADAPLPTAPAEKGPQSAPPEPVSIEDGVNAILTAPLQIFSLLDMDFSLGPWTFRGYLEYDGALYRQDAAGPPESDFRRSGAGPGDPLAALDLKDGGYLRRARVGGEGRLGDHIAYRAMFELGTREERGESRIAEVWASYSRWKPYLLQAGAYPQPANMEESTPADSRLFMERATAADLARGLGAGDGRLGLTFKRTDSRWMAAISLTGPVLNRPEDYSPRAAIVGRATRAFYPSKDSSLHLGASFSYVLTPARGEGAQSGDRAFPVRLVASPEVRVDDTALIDTGDISADHAHVAGLEFAARRRNLYLQAEGFQFGVQRKFASPAGDPKFWGYYIEGSWILTGEERRFDSSRGVFRFPQIRRPFDFHGGWGAWELAARYSVMDLNYHAGEPGQPTPDGGVRGGEQKIASATLEWYPKRRFRVMLNYVHVSVDRLNPASIADPEPFGPPPATPPVGVQIGQAFDIVAMRVRYAF